MADWQGIRHITVVDRLDELVASKPDALCVRMGDFERTYAQMDARARELAGQFHAVGASTGSRVATLAPNRAELLDLFFGLARLGVVQVPLNPFLKGEFLRHQIADSAPDVVVTDQQGWVALEPLLDQLPSLKAVVLLDPFEVQGSRVPTYHYGDMPTRAFAEPELTPESVMSIIYTSGTTGQPKGCILTHGYYCRCGQIDAGLARLAAGDVFFTSLPLFHGGSQLKVLMPALIAGVPVIVEPQFSASHFFRRISESGATVANGVGAMGAMIMATPPSEFDHAHRLRLLNIAPLAENVQEAFMARFGTDVWTETYGQTECVPILSGDPYAPRDRSSQGAAARDLDVALLDDDGQEVAEGNIGEICVRPRHRFAMFDGYWRNAEATLDAFKGLWYHTGDFGQRAASGSIRFVDRKKDALRVRGENVSSLELEAAMMSHPGVGEVAVHAVRSELGEDDIKACVVVAEGVELEPAKFFEWMRDNLPYYAVPRYVELLPALPKNPVNRVLKHVLRDAGVNDRTWDYRALGLEIARADRR